MSISLQGVPVFVYHGIADRNMLDMPFRERKYWISRAELAWQLRWARENGAKVVLLDALYEACTAESRSIVITFDDGNRSDYEAAYPLLLERGVRAHFFVNTATVGRSQHLDWAEIAEMGRSGMSIQSHSHEHLYLSRIAPDVAKEQMARSKAIIEERLGCEVKFLAVPFGDFNRRVLRLAEELGYQALCTGRSLPAQVGRGFIDRTVIYGGMSEEAFASLASASALSYGNRMIRASLKQIPKRIWIRFRRSKQLQSQAEELSHG